MGHPLTPGVPGALGVAPRGQSETSSNQNISLTKDVRYVSGVTKINFWSLPPRGPRELGVAPRGQFETSSNQNISLTKDVRYVSGVTKINFGSLPDPLGSRGHSGWPPGVKLKLGQIKIFR